MKPIRDNIIQAWLQEIIEQEVTEALRRRKHKHKIPDSAQTGDRNGHGNPRRFTFKLGTVKVRQPLVRNLEERFISRILPFFKRQSRDTCQLLPDLGLHRLPSGDFELAFRGVLGEGTPLSASSPKRVNAKWVAEYKQRCKTTIEEAFVAYFRANGLYVKAGISKMKAALLVVLEAMRDGSKRVLIT